eukprot:9269-Eustigmatos_ZCMA.PRE.1
MAGQTIVEIVTLTSLPLNTAATSCGTIRNNKGKQMMRTKRRQAVDVNQLSAPSPGSDYVMIGKNGVLSQPDR